MGTERNITGNWPNHFYFIPTSAKFNPEAPTMNDINEAIKQARRAVSVLKAPDEGWDWANIVKGWEDFAKRDPHQDFRPFKIKLGFDPAERPERTYAAPLHFFNQIKEHNMAVAPSPTITIFAGAGKNYLDAAAKNIADHHYLELPEAVIGETLNGCGNNPWVGYVGNLSISYKTDAARHLELALEHLVAAQTIPKLVTAYEDNEAKRAERLKAEFTQLLHTPANLDVLSAFNADLPLGGKYDSWREVQVAGNYNDSELLDFIHKQVSKQVKAKVEATYRSKRREELLVSFVGADHGDWERCVSDLSKKAIDELITREINDGACK